MSNQRQEHAPRSDITQPKSQRRLNSFSHAWWRSAFIGYPLAVVCVAATFLIPWIHVSLGVKDYFVGSFFMIVTLLVGWFWGLGPALLALVLSSLALDYWLIPPVGSLEFFHWPDLISFGSFTLVQLAVLGLIVAQKKIRQQLLLARQADRQHAEELAGMNQALTESNIRISSILESITDGFMHLDREWRYHYINEQMKEIIGRKGASLQGQRLWDTVPELLGTPFEQNYREVMAKQQAIHFECRHPTSRKWLDAHVYPIKDGITVYMSDITERKGAEESLRESEVRFRALVDANIIGIITSDLKGNVYEANDAFLSLVGYSNQDLAAGQVDWKKITPLEYRELDEQSVRDLLEHGTFSPYEKEFLTKEGKRVPVLLGGTFMRKESSENQAICFILDLTDRKAIEQQKDLMLGMTGHELKTPLAALKGTFQLLQRKVKRLDARSDRLSSEMRAFLEDLSERLAASNRQVDVQTHLINDLLDVSRITANTLKLELACYDLVSLVRGTVEDLRVTAPDRALLLELPENGAVTVLVDRDRISQVVTNYITNALRYSPLDQPVWIGLTVQRDFARVWVRDKGPGLTEEAQAELWQRFHQVKGIPVQGGSGKGLGLGLYICQTLIAQHHGEVGVESTPGQGSTFWFRLPITNCT